jgi:hypothetical protein
MSRLYTNWCLIAALAISGCLVQKDRTGDLPGGLTLAGDAARLRAVLSVLEGLEGTPLARFARELRARLSGCREFAAASEGGRMEGLLESLHCSPFAIQPPALRRLRADADLVFVLPLGAEARLAGNARAGARGSVKLEATLDVPGGGGFASFVSPSVDPPGPPRLSARDALLHARFRPEGGLDLATLVARGGEGDRLFRLRSELFAGAVLDGAWEAAVYEPPEGSTVPGLAIALDFRSRHAAVPATEAYLRELESVWPVHRTPFAVGTYTGACLPDLRLLPELGPCYVATDTALVAGWNPSSVRRALARGAQGILDERGGLVIRLDRIRATDQRLQGAPPPAGASSSDEHGWTTLEVRTLRSPEGVRVRADLVAREPS